MGGKIITFSMKELIATVMTENSEAALCRSCQVVVIIRTFYHTLSEANCLLGCRCNGSSGFVLIKQQTEELLTGSKQSNFSGRIIE